MSPVEAQIPPPPPVAESTGDAVTTAATESDSEPTPSRSMAESTPQPALTKAAQPGPEPALSDSDTDGVTDPGDMCAATPTGTAVDAFGCPNDAPIVLHGVNFKTDSADLTPNSTSILDRVSATLVAHPEIRVEVAGHTDSDGDDAYNKTLSQNRSETVMEYLVGKGVSTKKLTAMGYGEERPLASNATAEGKAQNRRVELVRR